MLVKILKVGNYLLAALWASIGVAGLFEGDIALSVLFLIIAVFSAFTARKLGDVQSVDHESKAKMNSQNIRASNNSPSIGDGKISAYCKASLDDNGDVFADIVFVFDESLSRPALVYWQGSIAGRHDNGAEDAYSFSGWADSSRTIETRDYPEATRNPEKLFYTGSISFFDLTTERASVEIIAKRSRKEKLSIAGKTAYVSADGIDEDGDLLIKVDLKEFSGMVVGTRAGFEDGIYEADWDIDLTESERDTLVRELLVCELEGGELVQVDVAIGKLFVEEHPFSVKATAKPDYPEEGITDTLDGLNSLVWDRGYYCETQDGTWYELYVNEEIKNEVPSIDLDSEDWEYLGNFKGINLDHYEEEGQITFFVPNDEEEFTLREMGEVFV